jgi:hypothetical protein
MFSGKAAILVAICQLKGENLMPFIMFNFHKNQTQVFSVSCDEVFFHFCIKELLSVFFLSKSCLYISNFYLLFLCI